MSRLQSVEVVKLNPAFSAEECNDFINKWKLENVAKAEDDSLLLLFSHFINRCQFTKSTQSIDNDLLEVIMIVSPDDWPTKRQIAEIAEFINSLRKDYDNLDAKVIFEVLWEDSNE